MWGKEDPHLYECSRFGHAYIPIHLNWSGQFHFWNEHNIDPPPPSDCSLLFHSKPSVRPESLNLTQLPLLLPLFVHHSPSLALGACLDPGRDRGYTQLHPHTLINTLDTTVLQVHQQASNNDLIPPGVRATRSRTAPTAALLLDISSLNQKKNKRGGLVQIYDTPTSPCI